MMELQEKSERAVRLDEESEGNSVGSGDFIFRKIGTSVPLKSSDCTFDLNSAPLQALAVSERFGVLFLAHSEGFYVARTKDVMELAKKIKEEKGWGSIQGSSIVDVSVGRVSILALSADSSTLAACVGGLIRFFRVASLIEGDKEPSFSCSLGESSHVKDLRWCNNEGNFYVILSMDGKLYHGDLKSSLKKVMDNVDAVDWNVKGDYVAVAIQNTLKIFSSDFKEQLCNFLLFQRWANDDDCILKVDCIKWVRKDSIIVGCLPSTRNGEEEGYLVQVIACSVDGHIEASSKPNVISFSELFVSIDDQILPRGCGPYLHVSYLERWELVLASNRKNTDQHIVSLGWSLDDYHGDVVAIEFRQDKEVPRIELPENGDDNLIVGFGIDKLSLFEKIEFIRSDGEHIELYPYCILLCLTSDGKLIMFHAARISDPSDLAVSSGDIMNADGDSSALPQKPIAEVAESENVVLDGKLGLMNIKAFDFKEANFILKENGRVIETNESCKSQSLRGQTSGSITIVRSTASCSDSDGHDSLQAASNKELDYLGTMQKSDADVLQDASGQKMGQLPGKQSSANIVSVVRDDAKTEISKLPYPSITNALKESIPQVTKVKGFSVFSSVNGQPSDVQSFATISGSKSYNSSVTESKLSTCGQRISSLEQFPAGFPTTQSIDSAFLVPKNGQELVQSSGAVGSNGASSLSSDTYTNLQPGLKNSHEGNTGINLCPETTVLDNLESVSSRFASNGKSFFSHDLNLRAPFSSSESIHGEEKETAGNETRKTPLLFTGQASPSTFESSSRNFCLGDPKASPPLSSSVPIQSEGHKTVTNSRTSGSTSSKLLSSLPKEDSKLGKAHLSKGAPLNEYSKSQQFRAKLDREYKSSKSFYNVTETVNELDSLLLDIEGEGGFTDACTVVQKNSVLELEEGLECLSEKCRFWKSKVEDRLGDVQNLLDKTMQVLAKKICVEGIVKQASNNQYWELWNRQKLSPEFELKRRHITELHQNLIDQIILLERHFNAIELNKFGDSGSVSMGCRGFRISSAISRKTQSLNSLYGTMNSQLTAAEQLSECLSKQMALLNVETPPPKKQSAAKALFDSIGLIHDGDSFQSPVAKTIDFAPVSTKKISVSSFSAIKEHSSRTASGSFKGLEPETVRRRRESLDKSLARFEPLKTTVKRMLIKERSKISANKPSHAIDNEKFISPMDALERSSMQPSIPGISQFKWAKDKVRESTSAQERVSVSPLSMDDGNSVAIVETCAKERTGSSPDYSSAGGYVAQRSIPVGQNAPVHESGFNVHSEPLKQVSLRVSSTLSPTKPASPRKTVSKKAQASDFSSLKSEESVSSKQSGGSMNFEEGNMGNLFSVPQKVHASIFSFRPDTSGEVQSGGTPTMSSASNISNLKSGEFVPSKQTAENINFNEFASGSSSAVPQKVHPSTFSFKFDTPSKVHSDEAPNPTISSAHQSSPSLEHPSSPSLPFSISASSKPTSTSELSLPSSATSTSGYSSVSSLSTMSVGGSLTYKGTDETVLPSTTSTSFLSSAPINSPVEDHRILPPPSPSENVVHYSDPQPLMPIEIGSKLEPAQSVNDHSEGLYSGSQFGSLTTASTSNMLASASNSATLLNSQPELSVSKGDSFHKNLEGTAPGKMEALDSTVIEEDEMEEEAPDATTLNLGTFGGFGLGSMPSPSAPKPNPFGVSFGVSASNPVSSPSFMSVPSGELFRPASFDFSSSTSQSPSPVVAGGFSGFGAAPSHAASTGSGFGQPAQIGSGQQALGSVLGAFGQSRQLGPGLSGVGSGGFGGGGFSAAAMNGGFGSGAAAGAGFAGAAAGAGFSGAKGGGFAGVASAGGGFAALAAAGGGFAAAASAGGFGGVNPSNSKGGFGAFSNSGSFSSFGGKPPEIFTQMRR